MPRQVPQWVATMCELLFSTACDAGCYRRRAAARCSLPRARVLSVLRPTPSTPAGPWWRLTSRRGIVPTAQRRQRARHAHQDTLALAARQCAVCAPGKHRCRRVLAVAIDVWLHFEKHWYEYSKTRQPKFALQRRELRSRRLRCQPSRCRRCLRRPAWPIEWLLRSTTPGRHTW